MVVKSNVVQGRAPDEEAAVEENGNQAILEECKRLIEEALQEIKER